MFQHKIQNSKVQVGSVPILLIEEKPIVKFAHNAIIVKLFLYIQEKKTEIQPK